MNTGKQTLPQPVQAPVVTHLRDRFPLTICCDIQTRLQIVKPRALLSQYTLTVGKLLRFASPNEPNRRRYRDVASYLFNWHSPAPRILQSLRGFRLTLSFMTIAETRMGAMAADWGARRLGLLEAFLSFFLSGFGVVYAADSLCTLWARVRAHARTAGKGLSPQDAWIAATALALKAPLAANNRRDFEHVVGLTFQVF
jgi:tRNA(fMet)-specific endonuclease VapC